MEPNLLNGNIIVVIVWLSDKLKTGASEARSDHPATDHCQRSFRLTKVFMVVI